MTTSDLIASPRQESQPGDGPTILELLKSFPSQAQFALGRRGILLAALAGLIGLVSCIVAFADIAVSLHRSEVDPQRQKAREIGRAHV